MIKRIVFDAIENNLMLNSKKFIFLIKSDVIDYISLLIPGEQLWRCVHRVFYVKLYLSEQRNLLIFDFVFYIKRKADTLKYISQ